jgi:small subunit ribosomal protein S15
MALQKEKKQETISSFRKTPSDTGSSEVQIALLTERINMLTEHLKLHKKDNSSRRGLLRLVSRRKKLLEYLKRNDFDSYQKVIEKLGLRK